MSEVLSHRLVAPDDFSSQLKSLVTNKKIRSQQRQLRELAEFELDYSQTIQFNQALNQLPDASLVDLRRRRVALLSNVTVDHLIPAIKVAGLRFGLLFEIYISPYLQYMQDLLDPGSQLTKFCPDHVVFSFSPREFLANVSVSAASSEIANLVDEYMSAQGALWEAAKARFNTTLLQQTFLNIGDTVFGNYDRINPAAPTHAIRCLNQSLIEHAQKDGVQVLDLDRMVERYGLDYWYDNARWLQAKIEISPRAAGQFAEQLCRVIGAHLGMSRKCLVLDLDNTLWGGVIGDDGMQNIVLGQGNPVGEAYLQFQAYVKRLNERGIILAVCSKNEKDTAESVFREHPEMLLGLDDISVFVANWDDKATNIKRIAEELNIGLDSLVLVDDNPAERARIRQALPMVAVPELPTDPANYVSVLANAGYFEAITVTNDDLTRNEQYAQNRRREEFAESTQSIEEYLRSLDMLMTASPFQDVDLPRVAQLINKTNQFNTTTRRRSVAEVRDLASRGENLTLQIRLSDRFGDNGLVSALILVPDPDIAGALEIETWVMSCRVFGRQLEYEIFNTLVEAVVTAGSRALTGRYIPTPRNALIENLYENLGFRQLEDSNGQGTGETRWILNIDDYSPHSTHIRTSQPT